MKRRKEMAALLARRERDGLRLRFLPEEVGIPIWTPAWWIWRLGRGSGRTRGSPTEVCVAPAYRRARVVVTDIILVIVLAAIVDRSGSKVQHGRRADRMNRGFSAPRVRLCAAPPP